MTYSLSGKRIWVAGHTGMVGSAIARNLEQKGDVEILKTTRKDLNLIRQSEVEAWMHDNAIDAVFVAAAKVGGIHANDTYPAEFLYDNLMIVSNIVHAAHMSGVEKLLFLGSSCIYPKFADQPIEESSLLTGALEPTNEWYAIAKIAGIKLCQAYRKQYGDDFISAMPTNLYGPGDNFHPMHSHVIPALMRKAHVAKIENRESIEIWGTGKPLREFLHADDCADALVHLMENYSDYEHVNVGYGSDVSIAELAHLVADSVGFKGGITFNSDMPDGTPKKLMSPSKLREVGWRPKIDLEHGLKTTYQWFLQNINDIREK